jgi:hypothetical protein
MVKLLVAIVLATTGGQKCNSDITQILCGNLGRPHLTVGSI